MRNQELQQCCATEGIGPRANVSAFSVHQLWSAHPTSSVRLRCGPSRSRLRCSPLRLRFRSLLEILAHGSALISCRVAEVDMSRMEWIGFDYDYTLAKYTSDLLPWHARITACNLRPWRRGHRASLRTGFTIGSSAS
jgi:hypothetical protein